jgi:Ca-activated chloride channel family protein
MSTPAPLGRVRGALLILVAFAPLTAAQSPPHGPHPAHANVIVPQARAFPVSGAPSAEITAVRADVTILEQVATTVLDIQLRNPSAARIEAELVVPIPAGATVRGFTFAGDAPEPNATLLSKDEARRAYDAIVAKVRDPALLEFTGCNLLRSSVFPLAPHGTQQIRLTYDHILPRDGTRIDYELPRSESLDYRVPWQVSVTIKSKTPIATVYSPTHALEVVGSQPQPNCWSGRLAATAATTPGPLRLSYLVAEAELTASLLAYPDPQVGGGYFLLLAGAPAHRATTAATEGVRREVTLVLDHSGSMRGEKLAQARAAALQVIAGLEPGEAFNIIAYNETVTPLATHALVKSPATEADARAFLQRLEGAGSTDIHAALSHALGCEPTAGMLPLVLFLTDGLPTAGNTSEVAIRAVATDHNPQRRRIFTFGVGVDVNTPLLQALATQTRGTATFVLPQEDVERHVTRVFKGLAGPVLTDAALAVVADLAGPPLTRVADLLPAALPDLFQDDQLVVLGRYRGDRPLDFELRGQYRGRDRTFRFHFALDNASTRNAFVPRLWASRRIAGLIQSIQDLGADAQTAAHHPRLKELTDEVLRLSQQFGILTEYTAFLAREGTRLADRGAVLAEAAANLDNRAVRTRSGLGAVNQAGNLRFQSAQRTLNTDNSFYDENMNRVSISNVQQVNDLAFFRRGSRWVDSRAVAREEAAPARVIAFDSPEFRALAERLAHANRAGTLALRGDTLLLVDDELVLIKAPTPAP